MAAKTPGRRNGKATSPASSRKLSRTRQPDDLSTRDWQIGLRLQYGAEQPFVLETIGSDDRFFTDYTVANPQSKRRYRVAIRGATPGSNYCSCPDYATNDLGICKHIAFVLARIAAAPGGRTALRAGFEPPYSEVWLDYAGLRRVRLRVGTDCPAPLRDLAAALFDPHDGWTLRQAHFDELPRLVQASAAAGHDLRCYDDALAHIAERRDAKHRARVLDEAYPEGASSAALKDLLLAPLYRYQIEGALFAARAGRALIGDEMGLGKTVQALAAARLFMRHFGVERVLVICPTSLKHQWQREFARFCGIEAQVVGGLRAVREAQYRTAAADCKITNYDTLARDLDLIHAWSPDLVIADEAQRVKNWATHAARALKQIASPHAVVLTGTPLENRLEELISIIQFVDRHRLEPTWKLLSEHQERDEAGRVVGYKALDRIGATLAPVMLRRRKAEVLDELPERIDKNLFVPMTTEQRRHHDENGDMVGRIVKKWRRYGYLSEADQRRLQCALQNMRMACDSTWLLDHATDHGGKVAELMALLEDLLAEPHAKVVVFSQWLRMHELIAKRLASAGIGYVLFHGGVPGSKRGDLVDRFTGDAQCRVFLSTDAGGVGLNLQHAAASVVNIDLPWNPAVLEQRIGRVYRLGQMRGVQVFNFVAQGTIEEGMLSVLAFKQSLFAGVFDGGAGDVAMHGTRLAKFMESVERVTEAAAATRGDADDTVAVNAEPAPPALEPEEAVAAHAEPVAAPVADPWATLLDAGMRALESLTKSTAGDAAAAARSFIKTDAATGRQSIELPLPAPETLQRALSALQSLLDRPRE